MCITPRPTGTPDEDRPLTHRRLQARMLEPILLASQPAPGRACGTCTLCCKVYDVPTLDKPAGRWCRHCKPGRGCGIHLTRPDHCRSFHCLWMTESWLGPEWKPERSKIVLSIDPATRFLFAQVDPGHATAWKRSRAMVTSSAGRRPRCTRVGMWSCSSTSTRPWSCSDRDVPLGVFEPGDRLVARERLSPNGAVIEVQKVRAVA